MGFQKWSKMIFSKIVPRLLGVLNKVINGYFEPLLTHIGPCRFPKTLEMGNLETHIAVQGGPGGMREFGQFGGLVPMKGAICIGTNLDDEQPLLTTV